MNNKNLWAPWRIEYLQSLDPTDPSENQGCFLCNYWNDPDSDEKNLVLWRTKNCLVLFNRFPYTGGHLLVAPAAHQPDLHNLNDETILEMMKLSRDAQTALNHTIKPHGFNIGININRCAGAGLPDHVHLHLVPRWDGDTNFMAVTGQVRIISQALNDLYNQLKQTSKKLQLPNSNK